MRIKETIYMEADASLLTLAAHWAVQLALTRIAMGAHSRLLTWPVDQSVLMLVGSSCVFVLLKLAHGLESSFGNVGKRNVKNWTKACVRTRGREQPSQLRNWKLIMCWTWYAMLNVGCSALLCPDVPADDKSVGSVPREWLFFLHTRISGGRGVGREVPEQKRGLEKW